MRSSLFTGVFIAAFSLCSAHGQEKAGTTLLKALGSLVKPCPEKCEEPVRMPQNHLSSSSAAITPTGDRLQPFGQPGYRGGESGSPSGAEENLLGVLPPIPDLRTPDQITKVDRKRMERNEKLAARKEESDAAARARKAEMEEMSKHPMDPSTAPVQVHSAVPDARDFGRRERPETATGGNLKPFNACSTYIEGCELKYKWSNHQFVEPQPAPDDGLGMLPPLPDLRTPDQISRPDKWRNRFNLRFLDRQVAKEAARETDKTWKAY